MFKLNNLRSPLGSNHPPKRKGKGIGSGWGKTAGKGHKGQHARSGGGKIGQAFEGGQMPLSRKLPKIGFRSPLKRLKIAVNINKLGEFAGQQVTAAQLTPRSEHRRSRKFVSVYGVRAPENLPKSVEAHRVSPGARRILESKGVAINILEYKNGHRSVRPEKLKKKKATATA